MNLMSRPAGLLALAALGVGSFVSCGSTTSDSGSGSGAGSLVATTTPLGSVAEQIAQCAGGEVTTLMGPGDDPHDFSPSSQQVVAMAKADLVVANGLGLEAGLERAISSAASDGARVLEVAPEVDPIPFGTDDGHSGDEHSEEEHSEEGHAEEHGSEDPHFWLDTARMATAAQVIGDEAAAATGDESWSRCGAEVHGELEKTDAQIRDLLAAVPAEHRVLVTDHDAFGYFAQAYDFEVAGVVIPGGSTDAEPSSADVAQIVDVVRNEQVPALFSNTTVSSKLVDAVAAEAGRDVTVVPLYVGSVGEPGSSAADYQGMVLDNARSIAEALSRAPVS